MGLRWCEARGRAESSGVASGEARKPQEECEGRSLRRAFFTWSECRRVNILWPSVVSPRSAPAWALAVSGASLDPRKGTLATYSLFYVETAFGPSVLCCLESALPGLRPW